VTPVYKLSASSITGRTTYGSMLAGNPAYELPGDFESIATVTVGSGGAANVEFTSIPSTFQHLQVRFIARSTRAENQDSITVKLNSVSTTSGWHILSGNGTSAVGLGYTIYQPSVPYVAAANKDANVFGAAVIDILDYKNTNKYTTWRSLSGNDFNGSGDIALTSGLYQSTSAISSILFSADNGNIPQYSHFALYGIKGA